MILTIFIQFSCVKRLHAHFCVLFAFFACFLYVNSHVCVMNSAGLPEADFFHVGAWATAIEKEKALPF